MKKWIALVLVLVMVLSACLALIGCQPAEKPNWEEGAVEVVMYAEDFEDYINNWMTDMANEFNKDMTDGINLTIKFFEDSNYYTAYEAARENGTVPDIFMVNYGNIYSRGIQSGYATPLNDLIDQKYFDDIKDNVKDMLIYDGVYYSYPQLVEPSSMFFYRKDYFEAAGVTDVPATWDELLAVCEQVKPTLKKGQYTIALPLGTALNWTLDGLTYNTMEHLALSDDWTQCLIDCPEYRELLGLWYDLYAGGYVPAGSLTAAGYNDYIEALAEGKTAMAFCGSWAMAELMATYPELKDKIGYAVLPTKDGNTDIATATNGGWTYAISSESKNKEAAAHVIEFFFCEDPERTASYFVAASYSKGAVTKSVQEYLDSNVTDEYKAYFELVSDISNKAIPEPTYGGLVSVPVAQMFETIAMSTAKDKNEVIEKAIADCVTTVTESMNQLGTNPTYKKGDH